MPFKLRNKSISKIIKELKGASKMHARQAEELDRINKSPKGKFRDLSAPELASWMIKSRKGDLSKIISSLNQQVVFRRNKDPKYAAKMRRTMDIVRKRIGKKDE